MQTFDLEARGLRELNACALHGAQGPDQHECVGGHQPEGRPCHCGRAGCPVEVIVKGSVGYYCAGMNKQASVHIKGSAGPGVGENMMSGTVIVEGDASQYAGATGQAGCWSSRAMPARAAASR
jgi:glutamate synthase domain-containing protein 3